MHAASAVWGNISFAYILYIVYIDYYIVGRTRDQVLIVDIDTYLQTKSAYGIDYLILST